MKKRYKIDMDVFIDAPENATDKDIKDYIAFELGANTSLSCDNPVSNSDAFLAVVYFDICEF